MAEADIDDPRAVVDRVCDPRGDAAGLAEPLELTRIGITRHPQQCPAIPISLFPRAAITLATRDPWCSLCVSCGSASLSTKSQPGTNASSRSGMMVAPVSTVAMMTRGSPVVVSQTCGRPIWRRPGWSNQAGSFG